MVQGMNNKTTLDTTIKYVIKTKKFDAQRFLYSMDLMALALILLLKLIFSFLLLFFFRLY